MSVRRPTLPNVSTTADAGSPPDTAPPVAPPPVAPPGHPGRPLALSPSRAADFKQCPLLYRYRAIDRFAETPTPAQTRGTVVHAALENLFDMPAELRTQESADLLVEGAWGALCLSLIHI